MYGGAGRPRLSAVARLTPEQTGALKLYLAIMRELDEADEQKQS